MGQNIDKVSLFKRHGPYLAPFERALIYEDIHTGWVNYTGPSVFKLKKSPYLDAFSEYTYIVPEDLAPPENAFVTVTGTEVKSPIFNLDNRNGPMSNIGEYQKIMNVEDWKYENLSSYLDMHTVPSAVIEREFGNMVGIETDGTLTMKEFLYYVSYGWENAEHDGLDTALAMQLVSCPQSTYGTGGIGVQMYPIGGRTIAVNNYGTHINRILPREFTKSNNMYVFKPVKTKMDIKSMLNIEKSTSEVNFAYLKIMAPEDIKRPVNIPILLEDAVPSKTKKAFFNPDILTYQLTALMINPVLDEQLIDAFERNILELERLRIRNDDQDSSFDLSSVNRIAQSFVRLRLRPSIDDSRFHEASQTFLRYYQEYLENKEILENFRGGRAYDVPNIDGSYIRSRLRTDEIKLLLEIMKRSEESGEKWVATSELEKDMPGVDIWPLIRNLQNFGYIIHKQNYGYLRAVLIDEELSGLE